MYSESQLRNTLSQMVEDLDSPSPQQILDYLHTNRMLNYRAIERHAIRQEVEKLYKAGMGRCDAMVAVAEKIGCSYEKVRALIYQKSRKNYAIRN